MVRHRMQQATRPLRRPLCWRRCCRHLCLCQVSFIHQRKVRLKPGLGGAIPGVRPDQHSARLRRAHLPYWVAQGSISTRARLRSDLGSDLRSES